MAGGAACVLALVRVDAVVTATYVVTLAAPVACYAGIRRARAGELAVHRLAQSTLVLVCWLAVFALELRIRFAGGSGAFVALARPDLQATARHLLAVHISVAAVTYLTWTWLAVASWRRFGTALPGAFSRRHRRIGLAVLGGLCFTAASATGMYMFAFVL